MSDVTYTYKSRNPEQRERINAVVRMINSTAYTISVSGLRRVIIEIFAVRMGHRTMKRILSGDL